MSEDFEKYIIFHRPLKVYYLPQTTKVKIIFTLFVEH